MKLMNDAEKSKSQGDFDKLIEEFQKNDKVIQ